MERGFRKGRCWGNEKGSEEMRIGKWKKKLGKGKAGKEKDDWGRKSCEGKATEVRKE